MNPVTESGATKRGMDSVVSLSALRLSALRLSAANLIPVLKWRRHGIGALQAYIYNGHKDFDLELRLHVWSPRLMVAGIEASGNAHNHRFTLCSTVLHGELRHTELVLQPDPEGDHETWDFVHARLQTPEDKSTMRRTGNRFRITERKVFDFAAGQAYEFKRGAYHTSTPLTDVVVTLVTKTDQVDEKACVIAPVSTPPVPAFGEDPDPELVETVLRDAVAQLQGDTF